MLHQSESCPVLQQHGTDKSVTELHFPPKFDIYGQTLAIGKNSGIGQPKKRQGDAEREYPHDWVREVAHGTKSALLAHRKKEDFKQLAKVSSEVKIRTIEELTGSHQVGSLVQGKYFGKECPTKKTRSKLREDRRVETLEHMRELANSYVEPEHRLRAQYENGVMNKAFVPLNQKQGDPAETSTSTSTKRAQTTALCGKRKPAVDVKMEIIRDRPDPPGLEWVEETKTQQQLLASRKKEAVQHMMEMAANHETKPRSRSIQRIRKIEPSPFEHMQLDPHDFGRDTKLQFDGIKSRKVLLDARKVEKRGGLEDLKAERDLKHQMEHQSITGPFNQGQRAWWNIERSASSLSLIQDKQSMLKDSFDAKRAVTCHPANNRMYLGKELNRKASLQTLPEKINHESYAKELYAIGDRKSKSNRFTDAVIEFRQQALQPQLDNRGKKLTFDPGETAPMYSSFNADQVFMELEDRRRADANLQMIQQNRRRSNKIPKRTFTILRRQPSAGAITGHNSLSQLANDSAARICNLVGPGFADSESSSNIRTGGFQNLF